MSEGYWSEIVQGPDEHELAMSRGYLRNYAELGYRHFYQTKFRLRQGLEYYALITRAAPQGGEKYHLSGYCAVAPWTMEGRTELTLKFVAKYELRGRRGELRFLDLWIPSWQDLLEDYRHFQEVKLP